MIAVIKADTNKFFWIRNTWPYSNIISNLGTTINPNFNYYVQPHICDFYFNKLLTKKTLTDVLKYHPMHP